jgi:DNA primase catalytic subunit
VTPTGMLYSAATAAAPARAKAEASTARASELIFDIIAVQLRLFDFGV